MLLEAQNHREMAHFIAACGRALRRGLSTSSAVSEEKLFSNTTKGIVMWAFSPNECHIKVIKVSVFG